MKKLNILFFLTIMVSGIAVSQTYDFPESVIYDHVNDQYLVANSGNGTIVATDLNHDLSEFISSGLNSPKDMHIEGNNLFVTDGNEVHIIDLNSASISQSVVISGAQNLKGITGNSDSVFVVDHQGEEIYYLSTDGSNQDLISDSWSLNQIYGIHLDHLNQLVVVSDRANTPVQIISRADGSVDFDMGTGLSNLSGLVQSANDDYYMATRDKDAVYRFTDVRNPPLFHDDAELAMAEGYCSEPGFIYYCDVNDVLAVPSGPDNTVHFIPSDQLSVAQATKEEIAISPNPGGDDVTIHVPDAYVREGNFAQVYTIGGQLVQSLSLTSNNIGLTGLSSGTYLVKFTVDGEHLAPRKVIIR